MDNTDVVYCTTFFTNMFDMNTFDLHIGPVRLNVHRWFTVRFCIPHVPLPMPLSS